MRPVYHPIRIRCSSPSGSRFFAPGGNDNKLCIWSLKSTEPVLKFTQHQAAVKVGDPGLVLVLSEHGPLLYL